MCRRGITSGRGERTNEPVQRAQRHLLAVLKHRLRRHRPRPAHVAIREDDAARLVHHEPRRVRAPRGLGVERADAGGLDHDHAVADASNDALPRGVRLREQRLGGRVVHRRRRVRRHLLLELFSLLVVRHRRARGEGSKAKRAADATRGSTTPRRAGRDDDDDGDGRSATWMMARSRRRRRERARDGERVRTATRRRRGGGDARDARARRRRRRSARAELGERRRRARDRHGAPARGSERRRARFRGRDF
eukprot:31028-Pelagococcus_subviridis.AAC.7